jgi:hypothetical protein
MKCFAARQGSADGQWCCGQVLVLLLGLLWGQFCVGHSSLWAPFVNVEVQLMYCLVLCSGFAGMHPNMFWGSLPHQDLHAKMSTGTNCQGEHILKRAVHCASGRMVNQTSALAMRHLWLYGLSKSHGRNGLIGSQGINTYCPSQRSAELLSRK